MSRLCRVALLALLIPACAGTPPAVAEKPVYVASIAIFNGWGQALAPDGGVVVTGAGSDRFEATPGAWDETAYDPGYPWSDAFLQKVDATGRTVWATWIGASGSDQGQNVTVGEDGSVYIAGYSTWSPDGADFPTTPGAMSSDYYGHGSGEVAWLMKFTAGGQRVWSTLVPGVRYVHDLVVDAQDRVHVTGEAYDDLPVTPGAFDKVPAGGEAFVATVNPAGTAFEAASYLGGSDYDTALEIALADDGSAYVAALTASDDAPTTEGAFDRSYAGGNDTLVARIAADGETLLWSTYLGGGVGATTPEQADEYVEGLTVDRHGGPVVGGLGATSDFPTTPGAPYPEPPGGESSSWVTRLTEDGSALEWSTFLPATVREPHLDKRGHTRLVGLNPDAGFAGEGSAAWTVLVDLDRGGELDRVAPIADQMAWDYDLDRAGSSYVLSSPRPASSFATRAAAAPDATLTRIPTCTIRGTVGSDELRGTSGPDVICPGAGDDVVHSRGGYDVILLGPGNDRAWSAAGVDVVRGGGGDDLVVGGTERDLLLGQDGADTMRGGDGPDTLVGGRGLDRLDGGAGRDETLER
jgi:Ca2+-binding RTX toxin-like protein